MNDHAASGRINRAVLVGLNADCLPGEDNASDATLEELHALLETAGGICVGTVLQNRQAPDARTFIGEGKVAEVKRLAEAEGADLVVFDNDLSPSQQRVLTEELGIQVMDPVQPHSGHLCPRARTREGCLQVELAQ
jgi:GTP-binding protein HflX